MFDFNRFVSTRKKGESFSGFFIYSYERRSSISVTFSTGVVSKKLGFDQTSLMALTKGTRGNTTTYNFNVGRFSIGHISHV